MQIFENEKKYERQYFSYINQNKFDISFLQMCYLTQKYNWIVYFFRGCTAASGVVETYIKNISKEFKEGLAQIKKENDEVLNSLSMRLSAVEAEKSSTTQRRGTVK